MSPLHWLAVTMTKTASPEQSQAGSATVKDEDAQHEYPTSTPLSEPVFSDDDAELTPSKAETCNAQDEIAHDSTVEVAHVLTRLLGDASKHDAAPIPRPNEANGDAHDEMAERAAKRRCMSNGRSTPNAAAPAQNRISPPWKKFEADGPTSFTDGGRRKSGRINTMPTVLQTGETKMSRRALVVGRPSSKDGAAKEQTSRPSCHGATRPASSAKGGAIKSSGPTQDAEPRTSPRRRHGAPALLPSPRREARSKPTPTPGTRRSSRQMHRLGSHDDDALSPSEVRPLVTKIKLRVRQPLAELALVHHDQASTGPKLGPTFEEYWDRAGAIRVQDGGMLADDEPAYTDEMARAEALAVMRIEDAVEAPDGLLCKGRCSVFVPEAEAEPPRQWAHADHLVKALGGFRRLMLMEQQRHRSVAKKLALACEAEWRRRNPQPKTAEEVAAAHVAASRAKWKQVMKAMVGMWDQVKAEVNKRRLAAWELEEQKRVKAALQQAVNLSEKKLQARRTRRPSADTSGEDEDEDALLSDDASDGNMSRSEGDDEDEASDVSDEALTQEQLRLKYADLATPDSDGPAATGNAAALDGDGDDTSDESVDMDDDMGSSDMDSDDDEARHPGLLHLLFSKSELEKVGDVAAPAEEVDMVQVDWDDEPAKTRAQNGAQDVGTRHGSADRTAIDSEQATPMTESNTNPPSTSQSPRTADTKPSDMNTPSAEPHEALLQDNGSESPRQGTPRTETPALLRGSLREYQHDGLDWLASLYANNTNGILADEMGLGKTIQTIALLAHLACHHHVWGPHLIIVPTSVMLNWEIEFKKWCPAFKIMTYYGSQDERKRKRLGWKNDDLWNVYIASYQTVLQDQQVFRRRRWHYMVLDEAHNIKNFKSQRWQALLGFNTHSRLLLTGTPLQNSLTELWSLLYFLAPPDQGEGGFADLTEFHTWFARPESQILENGREHLDDEARAIIVKLHKVLRPYLLRRLKADVEKQMPSKFEHVEFCRLSKRQRELYDGFLSRPDTRETLASGNYMSIINCLMQLRKVCNHPDLFVDRPIMTSFRMRRSVAAGFEAQERLVRKSLLAADALRTVRLAVLNLVPARYECLSASTADRIAELSSHVLLTDLREAQKKRALYGHVPSPDFSSVKSNLVLLESVARWGRYEELQHCVYLSALRRQQRPVYGKRLVEMLTLGTDQRPFRQRPTVPRAILAWFEDESFLLRNAVQSLPKRAASMETAVATFSCVTPAVVTGDLHTFLLGPTGIELFEETNRRLAAPVRHAPYMPKEPPHDPWHEARMRLTIQFPDKRLLQYDCGKLQALDRLLRSLQAGGHRALIFTQMTKVLDILEQFLNIHGHKYLRLDGATKVEQRQILTDRFNHDSRILCFILSTRSGGLGINLVGADTVIFYDQDWNPAMDKQCQDRCHRIGQTRDVHIYRLVSEHTIEANILRKAGQKQMLDDVVIQEGAFTTDAFFARRAVRDEMMLDGTLRANENDVAANDAVERVLLGATQSHVQQQQPGGARHVGRELEQAEDADDVAAARLAEKEITQDDADFDEQARPTPQSGAATSAVATIDHDHDADREDVANVVEYSAYGKRMGTIDNHMLTSMSETLKDVPLELPRDKKKSKKALRRAKDLGRKR